MSDDDTKEVLSPDHIDVDDEHVQPLDENRYVVSPDEGSSPSSSTGDENTADSERTSGDEPGALADLDGAYAVALQARFESERDDIRIETSDVSVAFESLLHWYAGKVADDTPPEEVIAVLLANSDLDVET